MSNCRELLKAEVREAEGSLCFGMSTSNPLTLYTVVLLFILVNKKMTASKLGSKEFLWLPSCNPLSVKDNARNQGRNLYTGTDAETTE